MCLWLLARRAYCVAANDENTPVFRSDVSTGRIDTLEAPVNRRLKPLGIRQLLKDGK
jgi:hypothetical protein